MMNDKFKRSMIELIKYEDYEEKEILLSILRKSEVFFVKDWFYTKKSGQRFEDCQMRVPIPLLKKARSYRSVFAEVCKELYQETEDYDLNTLFVKPRVIESDIEVKEHDVLQ